MSFFSYLTIDMQGEIMQNLDLDIIETLTAHVVEKAHHHGFIIKDYHYNSKDL